MPVSNTNKFLKKKLIKRKNNFFMMQTIFILGIQAKFPVNVKRDIRGKYEFIAPGPEDVL